jgi:hypothetical protein
MERAQGGLCRLRLGDNAFSSSVWDGAVQRACARGQLASLELVSSLKFLIPNRTTIETVASPELRCLSLRLPALPKTYTLVHEILERSPNLRKLELGFYSDVGGGDHSLAWLLKSTPDSKRPLLARLEILEISIWSPSLWEYLSRLGVKLLSVSLKTAYAAEEFTEKDPSGTVLRHILDVISGPRLLDFSYRHYRSPLPESIQAAVFAHPRRYVGCDQLTVIPGDDDIFHMKELELGGFASSTESLKPIINHAPPLRHLYLAEFRRTDASVAMAIRAVSKSLESLVLRNWLPAGDVVTGLDQTISAIGTAKSLRRLSLYLPSCGGFLLVSLEPLLFGAPPSQPPLCPRICHAHIELHPSQRHVVAEFTGRLRELIGQRCPYDGSVNGEPVCRPAVF